MPSNEIAEETGICTLGGWAPAGEIGRACICLGVGGDGIRSFAPVDCRRTGYTQPGLLIASEQAFGWFASTTHIACKDGERVLLSTMVDGGSVSERWFENVLTPPRDADLLLDTHRLWRNLSSLIPDGFNGALVKRSWRSPRQVATALKALNLNDFGIDFREAGGHPFLSVTQQRFTELVSRCPWKTTVGIAWAGFKSADGEREEIPFELGCFGLTYLTSLQMLGLDYSVQVDGLQYTSNWYVRTGAPSDTVFARGRTAFRIPASSATLEISWEDQTWVPVLSGFLSGKKPG